MALGLSFRRFGLVWRVGTIEEVVTSEKLISNTASAELCTF